MNGIQDDENESAGEDVQKKSLVEAYREDQSIERFEVEEPGSADEEGQKKKTRFQEFKNRLKLRFRRNLKLAGLERYTQIIEYCFAQIYDQLKAVLPISLYLMMVRLVIYRQPILNFFGVFAGLIATTVGLIFFLEGLKLAIMPLGETLGRKLPEKIRLWGILLIAFILGIAVTLAEPAIGALATLGTLVEPEESVYLYYLLTKWNMPLVLAIGLGVGFAAVIGILRFQRNWSLKPIIYITVALATGLTCYTVWGVKGLWVVNGLAWDCGAVTTGPVTVPIILSLGIGLIPDHQRANSPLSGFGIVTLASLFPVLFVLALGSILAAIKSKEDLLQEDLAEIQVLLHQSWYETSPFKEFVLAIRAIVPLFLLMAFILKFIAKEAWPNVVLFPDAPVEAGWWAKHRVFIFGLFSAQFGMIVFNWGLTYGLSHLGEQVGHSLPSAFEKIDGVSDSPFLPAAWGIILVVTLGWILGFFATVAEPALNVLGIKIEEMTKGKFSKGLLIYSVSFGVGTGISLGMLKIIYNWELIYMIFIGYFVALVVTFFSSEDFVNIAWDSAGVTTGPVTVPFVLNLGLSLGKVSAAPDGFGILTMASVGPIVSVMFAALAANAYERYKKWKRRGVYWTVSTEEERIEIEDLN